MAEPAPQRKLDAMRPANDRLESRSHTRLTWHNRLPDWIPQDPAYGRLRTSVRRTLQMIASACDPPRPQTGGSLLAGFGGPELIRAIGCSQRTFWRHLRALTAVGFVVVLARGTYLNDRTWPSLYGIPGGRGALDDVRVRRAVRRWALDPDGRRRLETLAPGEQPGLWADGSPCRTGADADPCDKMTQTPVSKWHDPPCQNGTQPSMNGSPYENHGGHGVSRRRRSRKRGLGHVTLEDLQDTHQLLGLFDRAVTVGLVTRSETDRLRFVGAAEHALRVANFNAPGLFTTLVRRQQWIFITEADDEAAAHRLRRVATGETPKPPNAEMSKEGRARPLPDGRGSVQAGSALSEDARLAWAVLERSASPYAIDAFHALKRERDWMRARWDAAVEELQTRGFRVQD